VTKPCPSYSLSNPLTQHYTDGSTSVDSLRLLPMLTSGNANNGTTRCLQLVSLDNGHLSFCNERTHEHCDCCGVPICPSHLNPGWVGRTEEDARLCGTCTHLSANMRMALYAIRDIITTEMEQHA
jgi:hypothetical protein